MDVNAFPMAGRMPARRRRSLGASPTPAPATPVRVSGGGVAPPLIMGQPDGPDLMLPSGLRIRRTRIGPYRVTDLEMQQAVAGASLLPIADQQLVARMGIPIQLLPLTHLEQVENTTAPVLGATTIDGPGRGMPRMIRIAAHLANLGTPDRLGEAVQHEIGHALSVLRTGDRSEAAAIAYAARY